MPLARAREGFRAWSWIAERREARLFGQRHDVTITHIDLGDRLRRARERVINQVDAEALPHIDVMSNSIQGQAESPTKQIEGPLEAKKREDPA